MLPLLLPQTNNLLSLSASVSLLPSPSLSLFPSPAFGSRCCKKCVFLHLCMCVCTHIRMDVFMCVRELQERAIAVYALLYVSMHACMCLCICDSMHLWLNMYACTHTRVFVCVLTICVCVCMCPLHRAVDSAAKSISAVQGGASLFSETDSKRGAAWSLLLQRASRPAQAHKL